MPSRQAPDEEMNSADNQIADETGSWPIGWWIIPSAIVGAMGWIAIFYGLGVL